MTKDLLIQARTNNSNFHTRNKAITFLFAYKRDIPQKLYIKIKSQIMLQLSRSDQIPRFTDHYCSYTFHRTRLIAPAHIINSFKFHLIANHNSGHRVI